MKKLLCVLLIALTLVPLAACGGEKDKVTAAADSADNQAPEASVSQKQPSEKKSEPKPAASEPTQSTDGVDVDLTSLSSTMVYSEVYNMMNAPGDYIGKTIKMTGQFVYYENPDTKAQYFTCIIGDAMACCSQGLEFVLTGSIPIRMIIRSWAARLRLVVHLSYMRKETTDIVGWLMRK